MVKKDDTRPGPTGRGLNGVSSGDEHLKHSADADRDQLRDPDFDDQRFATARARKRGMKRTEAQPSARSGGRGPQRQRAQQRRRHQQASRRFILIP
jgi:hypothetical protein